MASIIQCDQCKQTIETTRRNYIRIVDEQPQGFVLGPHYAADLCSPTCAADYFEMRSPQNRSRAATGITS